MINLLNVVREYRKEAMINGVPTSEVEHLEVTEDEWEQLIDECGTYSIEAERPVPWEAGLHLGKVFGVDIISR